MYTASCVRQPASGYKVGENDVWDLCGDTRPEGELDGGDDEGVQTQSKAPEGYLHETVADGTPSPSTESPMNTTAAPTGGGDDGVGTQAGCRCKMLWGFTNNEGVMMMFEGDTVCSNPDDDPGGTWCFIESLDSCPLGAQPAGLSTAPGDDLWDYCTAEMLPPPPSPPQDTITVAGCRCKDLWG